MHTCSVLSYSEKLHDRFFLLIERDNESKIEKRIQGYCINVLQEMSRGKLSLANMQSRGHMSNGLSYPDIT